MGLDINFSVKMPNICPHCGEVCSYKTLEVEASGGRVWHDFLTKIGGDLPYESETDGEERYGEDYTLTEKELDLLLDFLERNEVYCGDCIEKIAVLVKARANKGYILVVTADW